MPKLLEIVSAQASAHDAYWTPSETRRWPERAMAAAARGERAERKQSKARRKAGKAGKRDQLITQRTALGMAG